LFFPNSVYRNESFHSEESDAMLAEYILPLEQASSAFIPQVTLSTVIFFLLL